MARHRAQPLPNLSLFVQPATCDCGADVAWMQAFELHGAPMTVCVDCWLYGRPDAEGLRPALSEKQHQEAASERARLRRAAESRLRE